MARRPKQIKDFGDSLTKLKSLLDSFERKLDEPDLRPKVIALIPAVHTLRDIGSSLIPRTDAAAARDRILLYFQTYPQSLIAGDELMVVSGIDDWARRLRELRVELGWWIYSGVTFQQLAEEEPDQAAEIGKLVGIEPRKIKVDQYILVRREQDRDAAHRWNLLNSIRKKDLSVRDKLLAYFRENVGKPVTGEELRYLAKNRSEWARRSRELRTQDGWPVMTRQQGRTDLPIGSYVLEEDRQAHAHDRTIPDAVRVAVLKRDNFACRVCGWTRDQATRDDPRRLLELHHIEEHVKGGTNTLENLITLCNVDHDEYHAGRLDLVPYLPT